MDNVKDDARFSMRMALVNALIALHDANLYGKSDGSTIEAFAPGEREKTIADYAAEVTQWPSRDVNAALLYELLCRNDYQATEHLAIVRKTVLPVMGPYDGWGRFTEW
jgi:hypothetical protein